MTGWFGSSARWRRNDVQFVAGHLPPRVFFGRGARVLTLGPALPPALEPWAAPAAWCWRCWLCSLLQHDQEVVPTDSRWPAAALGFDVPTGQSVVTRIVASSQDSASPFLFIWKCTWAASHALISFS